MKGLKEKLHVAGILAAVVSAVGLLGSPEIAHFIPPKYAAIISAAGIVLQAVTKGVQHGGTDLVPKESESP